MLATKKSLANAGDFLFVILNSKELFTWKLQEYFFTFYAYRLRISLNTFFISQTKNGFQVMSLLEPNTYYLLIKLVIYKAEKHKARFQ